MRRSKLNNKKEASIMNYYLTALILFIIVLFSFTGCEQKSQQPELANPASVYCGENGGKLEIRNEKDGQVGYCLFNDGSECEEWSYFRGECKPGGSLKS